MQYLLWIFIKRNYCISGKTQNFEYLSTCYVLDVLDFVFRKLDGNPQFLSLYDVCATRKINNKNTNIIINDLKSCKF